MREPEQDTAADDPASRFDLDFSIMVLELAAFLPQLIGAVGGVTDAEQAAGESPAQTRSAAPEPA